MMNRVIRLATIAVCTFSLNLTVQSVVAETKTGVSPAHQAISIEVLLVRSRGDTTDGLALQLSGPSDEVAARIRELETAGRIVVIDRFRLTTVESQRTLLQADRTVPIATARVSSGRGGRTQTSYEHHELGTLISAIARVEEDAIIVELEVEKSQLTSHAGKLQSDEDFVPQVTETLTSHSTLRIGSGQTVIASGLENATESGASAQLLLVSVRLLGTSHPGKQATATDDPTRRQIRVFSLQHTSAKDAVSMVKALTNDASGQVIVTADPRTNSLFVVAQNPRELDVIEAILLRLDKGDARQIQPPAKDQVTSDVAALPTKYNKMDKDSLREELMKLQKEALDAERVARQMRSAAVRARKTYDSAAYDDKAEALLPMIEAEAASQKPMERFKKVGREFDAARQAYLQLLVNE